MKKKFIFPLIFSQVFNLSANALPIAETISDVATNTKDRFAVVNEKLKSLCGSDKPENIEEVKAHSNRLWAEILNQINNAKISYKTDLPFHLGSRVAVNPKDVTRSEPSIGGKFSGIDEWDVSLSALPIATKYGGLGISGTRKVTFIQQFPNRCQSLARLGYDPITNTPTNAQKALKLNSGDFVAFSAPLTFSIGKGISQLASQSNMVAEAGISYFTTGEIDVHIFRMDDDHVRVRFFAAKSHGSEAHAGLRVLKLNILTKQLIDVNPLQIFAAQSTSDLFSADYIFNLKDADAVREYNQVVGQQFQLENYPLTGPNPFLNDDAIKTRMYGDLVSVDSIAQEDSQKPLAERRIIRLTKGENNTDNTSYGLRVSLLKVVKAQSTNVRSDSKISLFNIENNESNYVIKSFTKDFNFNLFQFWGQSDNQNSGILLKSDKSYKPIELLGLQSVRNRNELSLTPSEITSMKNRLTKVLPNAIVSELKFPDVENMKQSIGNAHIEQSLYFNAKALENLKLVTQTAVEKELKHIILHWGRLNAIPMSLSPTNSGDMPDPRAVAKQNGDMAASRDKDPGQDYLEAYSYELAYMSRYISNMFSSDSTIDAKLEAYNKLQRIELFNEVGAALMLKIIPEDKLDESVTYKLVISGRNIPLKESVFPQNADLRATNLYNNIMADNAFMTDRSFNLRLFLNEKGDNLTLQEVVNKSK